MKNLYCAIALILFSHMTFAANCTNDVHEMRLQISQYKTIKTKNNILINYVHMDWPRPEGRCSATANTHNGHCSLSWKMGDWGNTFTCH